LIVPYRSRGGDGAGRKAGDTGRLARPGRPVPRRQL